MPHVYASIYIQMAESVQAVAALDAAVPYVRINEDVECSVVPLSRHYPCRSTRVVARNVRAGTVP